jgi:uncharacterized membrane protein YdjX (TVP38/TMEM64 family)
LGPQSVFLLASAGAISALLLLGHLILLRRQDWVSGLTTKTKYAISEALPDVAFEAKDFRIMGPLRLSPIIPFNAIN